MKDYIALQLFADAGTVVNATNGYVNAYTGARDAFTTTQTLAPELKEFYDTELLENARIEMYYAQFGKKQPLPRNHGGKVEWRKWKTFDKAGKLEEGVIPQGQKFGVTNIYGNIDQYGTYTAITDKLELRAYDDVILGATEEMGASAAETQETLIRDALEVNTNVMFCDNINTTSNNAYVSTPTVEYDMRNVAAAKCLLTGVMVNKAMTAMKKGRVPTINGKYYAVIHPSVAFDLRNDPEWLEAHKYARPDEIMNGEIGELHGVRFIENNFATIKKGIQVPATGTTRGDQIATKLTANTTDVGKALTGAGKAGVIGTYVMVLDNAANTALVGHYVNVTDSNPTAEASITFNGRGLVVGVDSTKLYFNTNFTNGGDAADDYVLPGDGAREVSGATDGTAIYYTYFFGKDAFGIIDPEGGGLEMIVHDKDEIGGPLNQFSTIGYKFETNGATVLYPERMLRVQSCSYFSDTDDAN